MAQVQIATFLGLPADAWTAIGTVVTALGALGTLAVAILAARYAKGQLDSARDQLDVMQRTREDETRPYVIVDVEPSEADFHLINLIVENIGRTAAHNVRLTFEPTLESTLKEFPPIAESVLVKEGISMMPPGRRIEALLDKHPDRAKSNLPYRFDVTVQLEDARGRQQDPQRYVLDLQQLSGLRHVNVYGVHHVAKTLQAINTRLGRWTDWRGELKVTARDASQDADDPRAEQTQTGDRSSSRLSVPTWLRHLAANLYVRGAVDAIPPLRRWLQHLLDDDELVRDLAERSQPLPPGWTVAKIEHPSSEWLVVPEAARKLGIPEREVYDRVDKGDLEARRAGGGWIEVRILG